MAFNEIEVSNYQGVPAQLYEFRLGTSVWRYAAGDDEVVVAGDVYEPIAIGHDGYSASGDPSADDLTINISALAAVNDLFDGTPPSDTIELFIRSYHHGDVEAPVVWAGSVRSSSRVSSAEARFTCNSLLATLNRNGLRLSWQRGCPHALYDRQCRVNPEHYATAILVESMDGGSISAASISLLPDGYLDGGFLSFAGTHGTTERRGIERQSGTRVELLGPSDGIAVGEWVIAYPGCNRTTEACLNKFNNLDNYGGFPHIPNKSPFDGDPVF